MSTAVEQRSAAIRRATLKCRGCKARIFFAKHSATQAMMPFDEVPGYSRWEVSYTGEGPRGPVLVASHLITTSEAGYASHFGTCPARAHFSRKKKRA